MWLKKLRRNRLQFILIAIILFFTAIIFSACLSFTLETSNYTQNYYAKGKSPDFFLNIQGKDAGNSIVTKAKQNEDFNKISTLKGKLLSEKLEYKGNNITPVSFFFYTLDNYKNVPWDITPTDYGKIETKPANGEVWVTKVYADLKNIQVGDKIVVKNAQNTTLTVSALIDDATCSSSLWGIYPFYVNENTLSKFSDDADITFVTINSKKGENTVSDWLKTLPNDLSSSIVMKYGVNAMLMTLNTAPYIIGGIGILASLLIFAVSIIIIKFLIKSNLLKEYRSIGIYKALGFKNRQIQGFYLKCYLLVGGLSILFGSIAGIPFGYYIGLIITKYITGFHLTALSVLIACCAALLLYVLLILNAKLAYTRINKITPVEAFQIGMTATDKKLSRSVIKNAHSPLAMAVNDIFKHKSFSVMYLLILMVSFYLCILFADINYSGSHIQENTQKWFNFPQTNCLITGPINDKMINYVKDSSYVSDYIYGNTFINVSIKCEKNQYGADLSKCFIVTWNNFSDANFWSSYKSGRGPRNDGEIAVSSSAIKGSSLTIGDYIELTIGKTKKSFLVTGIYDSMIHGGTTIEMMPDELKKCSGSDMLNSIAVSLKNNSDFNAFKKDIKNHFSILTVDKQSVFITDSVTGLEDLVNPVTIILVVTFILFSLLNIINLLLTTQLDNRRKFGILKSLGFTTGYICRQTFYKTLLLSIVSAAAAIVINFAVSGRLFYAMISVDGYVNNLQLLSVIIAGIFALILIISMLFCIPLRKISPVDLMEE